MIRRGATGILLALVIGGCDHGIEPPDEPSTGTLRVQIAYKGHPAAWPPESELQQLLFVAMQFVPRDTTDFLQLNRMVISGQLDQRVAEQTFVMESVPTGFYPYAGVAQKFGPGTFDWRPVGLVRENDGSFFIVANETTDVSVTVDFTNPPDFPPPT